MDYFNLKAEYQGLLAYNDKNSRVLLYLKDLLNNYYKLKNQALNTIKISFDSLLLELSKPYNSPYEFKHSSGSEKIIKEFIHILNVSFSNEINQNNKLNSDIIKQINDYIKFINDKNILVLNDLSKLIDKVYSQKKNYEEIKELYLDYGKKMSILEEKLSMRFDSKNTNNNKSKIIISEITPNTEEEENKMAEQLKQIKKNFIQSEKYYKEVTQDTNTLYKAKNDQYFQLLNKYIENEENKENFFKCCFEKYNYHIKNTIKLSTTICDFADSSFIKISKNEITKESFKNNFDIFLNKDNTRIKQESFIDYEVYKAELFNLANKNRMFLKEDGGGNNDRFNISLFNIFNNEYKINSSNFKEEEKLIIKQLFMVEDIDNFKYSQFCMKIRQNKNCAKDFIDTILDKYTLSIGVQILNENNFIKLEKILNNILLNNEVQKNLFELNFAIAYISEKTFYQDDKNPFYKIYLCKLLMNDNPLVKTKQFWLKLLKLKIKSALESKADKESKKLFKEEKENEKLLQEKKSKEKEEPQKLNNSTMGFGYSPSLFQMAGNMVNSFWYGKDMSQKQRDEIRKQELYHSVYYSKSKEVALKIINEFSVHFACFCLNPTDIMDILNEISDEYNIKGEEKRLKYLVAKINSNMYSIKNSKFKKLNLEKNEKNINNNGNKNYFSEKFLNKNYLKRKIGKNNKGLILLNAMKYLPLNDYINILKVNKSTYKLISRILYKNLLMNVDEVIPENDTKEIKIPNVWKNPELRIRIWKILLNYKKVDYFELKKKLNKENIPNINIIKLDTKRMIYKEGENSDITQESLIDILSCIAIAHPKINYSQGMNYIAYFLYEICKNEEEAFQIFNCLLTSTAYGDLFFDDLSRLNKYFYVFDRLIFIYLPEISLHLKNKDLSVRYFISPWFITLFTNAFKNIKDQENPKILKWIFDLFIINGWKSIIKIGLCLIKHFEIKILSCDLDELLHFLINDILKFDFFQNDNYDNLRNIYEKLKIENALIENIENEYELKNF